MVTLLKCSLQIGMQAPTPSSVSLHLFINSVCVCVRVYLHVYVYVCVHVCALGTRDGTLSEGGLGVDASSFTRDTHLTAGGGVQGADEPKVVPGVLQWNHLPATHDHTPTHTHTSKPAHM